MRGTLARTRLPSTEGNPRQIEAHHGQGGIALLKNHCPGSEVTLLRPGRFWGAHTAEDGYQRIWHDHPDSSPHPQANLRLGRQWRATPSRQNRTGRQTGKVALG